MPPSTLPVHETYHCQPCSKLPAHGLVDITSLQHVYAQIYERAHWASNYSKLSERQITHLASENGYSHDIPDKSSEIYDKRNIFFQDILNKSPMIFAGLV